MSATVKKTRSIFCIASPLSDVDFSVYWLLKDHEFLVLNLDYSSETYYSFQTWEF